MWRSVRHSLFRIPHLLERLFGRRASQLRQLAQATGAAAVPLTVTEVRHAEFSLVLPGAWHERSRTPESCRLDGPAKTEGLSITVKKLVILLPQDDMAAWSERLLSERQRLVDRVGDQPTQWGPPEFRRQDGLSQTRCDGYAPERQTHYALLQRVSPEKVLSALLWAPGNPQGGPAFSNLATVIFDSLSEA